MAGRPVPSRRILILQGHPDATARHYGHALADAYTQSAAALGHDVRQLSIAHEHFPLIESKDEWEHATPDQVAKSQGLLAWAEHIVILFPLWLGSMPAVLKGFLEQVLRPGFALTPGVDGKMAKKNLKGRTAHIVVTMGMPALFYRLYYRAHGVKLLQRNILAFCGIETVRTSLIGLVEAKDPSSRDKWIARMRQYGAAAN